MSAVMQVIDKIKILQEKLYSYDYVEIILAALLKGELPHIDFNGRCQFGLNSSDEFCKFFLCCNNILGLNDTTPNFKHVDDDYIMSLIYCSFCSDHGRDFTTETESPAIQATIFFFHLCSDRAFVVRIDKAIINSISKKVLQIIEQRVQNGKMSPSLSFTLNRFLAANIGNLDMEMMVDLLVTAFMKNTITIDDIADTEPIFRCLATIIQNQHSSNFRIIFVSITLKLIRCCTNEVLTRGVILFFTSILHRYCEERWYLPLLLAMLKQMNTKEMFIDIINQLSIDKYEGMVNMLVSNYVLAISDEEIDMYLTTMNLIVTTPHPSKSDDSRERIIKRIFVETYFRSSHQSRAIKERVIELFINWCQMRDIIVRRQLQQMFQSTNKIHMARLFEVLLQSVDISWKSPPSYNVTFIILTCRIFMINKVFITHYRMRVLEMLCYKAPPQCLKPCVPVITELIRYFTPAGHVILKPMLIILINNALTSTEVASYYMKETFDLLSKCIKVSDDTEMDFVLCNLILSDDFNCLELFKKLQNHNYIRAEDIRTLMNENILKHPCSWKLLSVLLENIDFPELPQFMEYYATKMNTPSFFTRAEAPHFMQVLVKIFASKVRCNRVSDSDVKVAETIQDYLLKYMKMMLIPAKHIGESIILLLALRKVTKTDLNWFDAFFKKTLKSVLNRQINLLGLPFTRHLMYLEQMLLLGDIQVRRNDLKRIVKMMSPNNQNMIVYEHIYGRLISFFGKICLKYESQIPNAFNLFEYAMLNGPPAVQMLAVSTLYDMSLMKSNCFDMLYSGLLVLLQSACVDLKNFCVKVLFKMINNDYVRLNCSDFITLMLVLTDGNYKLCIYFIDVFEKDFIPQNKHTISKYFIPLMFYMNNYEKNEVISMKTRSIEFSDFSYERRVIIYKFLYCNLEQHSQNQILIALNENFLTPLYKGKLNSTSKALNVLRDVLALVVFHASQYEKSLKEIDDTEEFYKSLFQDMSRDFFAGKRQTESNDMDFDRNLQKLLISLLKILYKIEKTNLTLLPQVFGTISIVTRTFYNKVLDMVHENAVLRQMYREFESCFMNHKEKIKNEPLNFMNQCDREVWRALIR